MHSQKTPQTLRVHKTTKPIHKSSYRSQLRKKSSTALFTPSTLSYPNAPSFFTTQYNSFSTENADQGMGDVKPKKEKEKKSPRSWLQIYSEMQLRTLSGALPNKITKNDQRIKARNEYMKDFMQSADAIKKLIPNITDSTLVWCRPWAGKELPQLIPFSEAVLKANEMGLQVAGMRSATKNPEKPGNMAAIQCDGVLPVWLMDSRTYMEDLYSQDTFHVKGGGVKDITINTTITSDDLQRKLQQCIDFLFEGNTVKISCQSKAVRSVQDFVEKNTHFDHETIETQAAEAIDRGKTLEMDDFLGKNKNKPTNSALENKVKAQNKQQAGETDTAYKKRVSSLVQQAEAKQLTKPAGTVSMEEKKQKLKQLEARINQNVARVMGVIKKMEGSIKQQTQKFNETNTIAAKDPKHRLHKQCKELKRGQLLEDQEEFIQGMKKEMAPLEKELGSWKYKLSQVKQGVLVSLGGPEAKVSSGGAGGELNGDFADDLDDFDEDSGQRDAPGAGDDDDEKDKGEKKQKMSKRELQEAKQKAAMNKMSAKEKVQYLAGLIAKQDYPVMAELVEVIGKLSCIVMQERQIRKKEGGTLEFDEMDPERLAKLSNKDKKRYEQRLDAQKSDPHAELKLELQNAMKLIHTKYLYNDVILEQQTKKPFWVNHGASSIEQAARTKQLVFTLSKAAEANKK